MVGFQWMGVDGDDSVLVGRSPGALVKGVSSGGVPEAVFSGSQRD